MASESKVITLPNHQGTTEYVEMKPIIDDNGIYAPEQPFCVKGCSPVYRCVMTKEMFVEAYNRYIKNPASDDMK